MTVSEFLRLIGDGSAKRGTNRLIAAVSADDCLGFCLFCGEDAYGVEPDARRYRCESCGMDGVFGAEEILSRIG